MEDLGMHRVSAKFVPRIFLTDDQKLQPFSICENFLQRANDNENLLQRANDEKNILKNVITGDERWVYGCDIKTKQRSSHWKIPASSRPKNAQQVRSQVKAMLLVFFDRHSIVHYELTPKGQTINQDFYLAVLRCSIKKAT
jgi:hypothetical protein